MEKEFAILIADLSGYTALTETHGAATAADLIDKYLHLVESSLTGSSRLHERTGDEILVLSEEPDDLLATALQLLENTGKEENFLQLHGGLHYGKLLQRNSSYFGAALNFTARIAAKAGTGAFWCSKEFKDAVSSHHHSLFDHKGSFAFKNISGEKDVYEVVVAVNGFLIDPVCHMLILSTDNAVPHPIDPKIFFCSQHCLQVYEAQKEKSGQLH